MHLFLLFLLASVDAATIGSIKQARISTLAPSIWLYNQSSWSQCICYALQDPSVVAFNRYASNSSCELFQNLSSFPFQVINTTNVTVYLLQPLQPYSPCCSNLTWLLSQIKSVQTRLTVSSVSGIALDTDRKRFGALGLFALSLLSADSFTLLNSTISLPVNTQAITYHRDLFYVGVYMPGNYRFYIYSALNLTLVRAINFTEGSPQHIIWLYNETLVCIVFQKSALSNSIVSFYNWPSLALNYSIQTSIASGYPLAKAPNDDTFVYIGERSMSGDVWQMKTSSPYTLTRIVTGSSIVETIMSLTVDHCNRLWVGVFSYGIRIYNISSGALLGSLDSTAIDSSLYDMVLTDEYQLYLPNMLANKLTRYGSALQCTN